ncbi:hypothetical protein JCM11491_004867 [Sporobolomyces phaffii]
MSTSRPSFRTERLVYRAIASPLDDSTLLDLFGTDEPGQFGWTDEVIVPWTAAALQEFYKAMDKATFAVMICLPDPAGGSAPGHVRKPGDAIGFMALHPIRHPHRRADFGIALHRDHQGKGYAAEAIGWLLERAFVGYGLNRVQGACFSFNERALKCYTSLGFVEEGRRRSTTWQHGAYHDDIMIGILASEWFARRNQSRSDPADP